MNERLARTQLVEYLRNNYSGKTHKQYGIKSLDLCFLVDCTLSMRIYVEKVNNKIYQIIDEIQNDEKYKDYYLRIAFVGYRDYGVRRFDIIDFVDKEQIESFKERIKKVKLLNNADYAEDVFGGLHKALGLQWESFSKLLIHFADAPCHGSKFWSKDDPDMPKDFDDRYESTQDPDKRDATSLLLALRKRRIYYTFAKINGTTNTMIRKFKSIYDRPDTLLFIETQEMQQMAKNFVKIVVTSVKQTLQRTNDMSKSFQLSNVSSPKNMDLKLKDSKMWQKMEEATIYRLSKSNTLANLIKTPNSLKWEPTNARVEISQEPFASGKTRTVYKLLYHEQKCLLVVKNYLDPPKDMDLEKKWIKKDIISQVIAKRVVKDFNLKKLDQSIDFLEPVLIDFHNRHRYRYFYCETFLEGKFCNIKRNTRLVKNHTIDPNTLSIFYSHAFTHFSWQFSRRRFCITNSKRVGNIFTNIKLHTKAGGFSKTDLGFEKGIKNIFHQHICNIVCLKVGCKKDKMQPQKKKILGKPPKSNFFKKITKKLKSCLRKRFSFMYCVTIGIVMKQ